MLRCAGIGCNGEFALERGGTALYTERASVCTVATNELPRHLPVAPLVGLVLDYTYVPPMYDCAPLCGKCMRKKRPPALAAALTLAQFFERIPVFVACDSCRSTRRLTTTRCSLLAYCHFVDARTFFTLSRDASGAHYLLLLSKFTREKAFLIVCADCGEHEDLMLMGGDEDDASRRLVFKRDGFSVFVLDAPIHDVMG